MNNFNFRITAKSYFSIIILTILFSSCGKETDTGTKENKSETSKTETPVKESVLSNDFIVNYDLEGAVRGKMEIIRNGEKIRQNISSEVMGMKSSNIIYIMDKNVYSIIDVNGKKLGTKTDLAGFNKSKQTAETITDFKEFEKYLDSKKISGTEYILGYKCDIYETSDKVSISVHNKRYILKIKTPEFMATATSINTSPAISGSEFILPSDVEFNKTDAGGLKGEALDSLVNKLNK